MLLYMEMASTYRRIVQPKNISKEKGAIWNCVIALHMDGSIFSDLSNYLSFFSDLSKYNFL